MSLLKLTSVSKTESGTKILKNIDWEVNPKENWVVLGPNGSGKSTLMDIIANENTPDNGKVAIKKNIAVAYLKQDNFRFHDKPLLQEVLEEPEDVINLRQELTEIHNSLADETDNQKQKVLLRRMSEINDYFEFQDENNSEHQAKAILSGLGFKESDFERSF